MRKLHRFSIVVLILSLYTAPIFACAFRELVEESLSRKEKHFSRTKSDNILEDPIPPAWATTPEMRKANIDKWEREILEEAAKAWEKLGVSYKRIKYAGGDALEVTETGSSPLNEVYARSMNLARKDSNYKYQVVFSPRKLVREWSEKKIHYLVGGSFRGDINVVHLPFSSFEQATLSSTFHHEFLHALFDYLRETGKDSTFHGAFFSRDGVKPMWKGTHYTEYMNLEELATFPINHIRSQVRIERIKAEPDALKKSNWAKRYVEAVFGHSLTNAVNSEHARDAIGHILRHAHLKDVSVAIEWIPNTPHHPTKIKAVFQFANIRYVTEVADEALQPILPELRAQKETDGTKMKIDLRRKVHRLIKDQLLRQYEMSNRAAHATRALVTELQAYREMPKTEKMTNRDLDKISELLLETRRQTLPFILPNTLEESTAE